MTCINILPEEEKRDERVKKEQEKAKKLEEKRLKDEEKRKSRSGPVGTAIVSAEKTRAIPAEGSAPVLDPIPTVAPLNTEEISEPALTELTPTIGEANALKTENDVVPTTTQESLPDREKELSPEVTDEQIPTATEETEPIAAKEIIPENIGNDEAAAIAARVFSAPIVPSSEDVEIPPTSTDDLITAPSESTQPGITAAATNLTTTPARIEPAQKESTTVPFVPTVTSSASGPQTTPSSPKSDGGPKLSSWLKSKFSRNGKPAKASGEPAQTISQPSTSKTNLTTDAPMLDSDAPTHLGSSAGGGGTVLAPQQSTTSASHPTRSRSTSISSLSSDVPTATNIHSGAEADEPMRGRTRSNELRKESTADSGESSTPEEFEEARDQFDGDKLPLPSFPAGQARPAESPVRDSRFVENL